MKEINRLEEVLGIKLEPYKYGERIENAYSIFKDRIDLHLNNVSVNNLGGVKNIHNLTIKNSIISDLTELLKTNIRVLNLENATIKSDKPYTNNTLTTLYIRNTNFNARGLKKCLELKILFFTDCTIYNSYKIAEIPKLYQVKFDRCKLEQLEKHTISSSEKHWFLDIANMSFDNINSFLCFKNVIRIGLENCKIKSISDLYLFKNIEEFDIDSNTSIENTEKTIFEHNKIKCNITQKEQEINLKNLFSIAHYIDTLNFINLTRKKLNCIEEFTNVKHLSFEESDVFLDCFLKIASNIETLKLDESTFEKTECIDKFTKLTSIFTNSSEKGIYSLKELLPIKHQLKSFISFDDELKDVEIINEFQKLELLQLCGIKCGGLAQILTLGNLKHLYLDINLEEDDTLTIDLGKLKSIERLNLCNDTLYIGFEHLTKLKSLRVESNFQKISPLPKMEKLDRLHFEGKGEIKLSSKEFPNLRELKIEGEILITLDLPSLEILEMSGETKIKDLGKLPNLKKMSINQVEDFEKVFKETPNLKYIKFQGMEQEDLQAVQQLKNIEYIDLYDEIYSENKITDISVLNKLLNLKEVNLANKEHLSNQLDEKSKAVYHWLNTTHFKVYEEDDLWI